MNAPAMTRRTKSFALALTTAIFAMSALAGQAVAAPDRTAPVVSITSPAENSIWGTSAGNIVFTATDNVGVTSTSCNIDGGAYRTCTSNSTGSGFDLPNGRHTVCVEARDAAGNVGRDCNTWTVDGVVVKITSPASKQVIRGTSVPVAFTVADSPTSAQWGNTSFATYCRLDYQTSYSPCTSGQTLTNVAVGPRTLFVRAIGNAGPMGVSTVGFTVK